VHVNGIGHDSGLRIVPQDAERIERDDRHKGLEPSRWE
jgi:hypothetical protein